MNTYTIQTETAHARRLFLDAVRVARARLVTLSTVDEWAHITIEATAAQASTIDEIVKTFRGTLPLI